MPKTHDKVTNVLKGLKVIQIATNERWLSAFDARGKTVTWNFNGFFDNNQQFKFDKNRLEEVTIEKKHSNKEYFFGITVDKIIKQQTDNLYMMIDSDS